MASCGPGVMSPAAHTCATGRVLVLIHDDLPVVVALASELRAEVVGRALRQREEEVVAVEVHAALELQGVDPVALGHDSLDARRQHGNVQCVELRALLARRGRDRGRSCRSRCRASTS